MLKNKRKIDLKVIKFTIDLQVIKYAVDSLDDMRYKQRLRRTHALGAHE